MKRFSAVLAVLAFAASAHAITYGYVDSTNTYSNTGAFIVKSPTTGYIYPICSGTLIAPNVFLTASHCTQYYTAQLEPAGYTVYVTFDAVVPFGDKTSARTKLLAVSDVVTNPLYGPAQNDSGDIGALILASKPRGVPIAPLPQCGLFDQLAAQNGLNGTVYTNAGYGLQNRVVGGGVPYYQDVNPIPRMFSFSTFEALNGGYIRLSQNSTLGDGGTCFGDSGGPQFFDIDGVRTIVAITITGDSVCRATNVDYRLDTPSAIGFFSYVNANYGTAIPISGC